MADAPLFVLATADVGAGAGGGLAGLAAGSSRKVIGVFALV